MILKVIPTGDFESYESFECRRFRFKYASDLKETPPTEQWLNEFDAHVIGPEPLQGAPVVLRLDHNSENEQLVIITARAQVYVMNEAGQTIDRFQVS
jgi:hypothetical protein